MYQTYGDRAEFLFVYIREAHPADSNWADHELDIDDPLTQIERNTVAQTCCTKLSLTLPTVVDDMQDTVNQLYRGWPERIYVIGRKGNITYKAGLGPFGFKPSEAERALKKLL